MLLLLITAVVNCRCCSLVLVLITNAVCCSCLWSMLYLLCQMKQFFSPQLGEANLYFKPRVIIIITLSSPSFQDLYSADKIIAVLLLIVIIGRLLYGTVQCQICQLFLSMLFQMKRCLFSLARHRVLQAKREFVFLIFLFFFVVVIQAVFLLISNEFSFVGCRCN